MNNHGSICCHVSTIYFVSKVNQRRCIFRNIFVWPGRKMKLYNILAVLVLLKTILFSKYLIQHICSMLRELDIILGDIVMYIIFDGQVSCMQCSPPSGRGDLILFWLFCLGPLLLPITLKLLDYSLFR